MAINEAVNIDIDVNGTSTVKQAANAYDDLGDAVSKTQLEAEKLAQQFGINDKRTQEAIKVAGRYKQEMEELDFAIDAARGGSDQLFRAAQGVTAGFELAAGATALFGGESEELEKILIKVQGAMVFSQGLRDLKEFAPAIFNAAEATRVWFTSLTLLQKSFVGFGIALIVDAIIDYRNATSDAADETERLSEANKAYAERNEILIRSIQRETEEQVKKAILARKTEDEILQIRKDGADKQLAYIRSLIEQEEKDKNSGLIKDQERFKLLARLEGDALREIDKLEVDIFKRKEERRKKSTENDASQTDEEFQNWLANEIKKNEAQQANAKYVEEQRKKEAEDNEEAFQAWLEWEIQKAENAAANAEYITKKKKEESDKQIAMDQAVADAQMQLYLQTQMVTSGLIQLVGEQTKAGKALALAQIAADTAVGYVQGLDIAQKGAKATGPAAPYTFPIFYASQIAAVINAVNQARQVLNGNYSVQTATMTSSQGFGSVSSFNAPAVRLPRTEQFTGQQRIYVTEYDISNTQEKVKVTEDVSIVK